ncbi:unnamed protein product [Callosobruchus maculatus]|uniref:Phosphatidic acid phosphatase type 2/haloperoxidase domain-containing protein n=1 Tax=Callosobruchus maculatus TaxID=64391 RepID=A0A653DB67_CALMS|nr:unnamed protein product [Callosobruchus maculatus]
MITTNFWVDLFFTVLLRIALWTLYLNLNKLPPIIRHIDEEELWYYRYPSLDSIVPTTYLYLIMICVPTMIFAIHYLCQYKDERTAADILNGVNGLTLAYCLNGLFSGAMKITIGRPRPNFYLRCFPDGYGTDLEKCVGAYHGQMDGRKSFPSAHSSFVFTGMIYMMLYIYHYYDFRKPRAFRSYIVVLTAMLPLTAILVSVSRTADYHHHYSDVIGGALLGTIIAATMQHIYCRMDDDEALDMRRRLLHFPDPVVVVKVEK